MTIREKLFNLGYPVNIGEMIEKTEGVSTQEETDDYYIIWDNYEHNDRFLQINKRYEIREEQFEFFSNNELKESVLSFAKQLPPILFMNLKKVFFVNNEEHLMFLSENESPNHTFSMKYLGMAVYNDSTAIINTKLSKKLAKEEYDENIAVLGYSHKSEEQLYRDIVLQTLAHELYHLAEQNPLIEEHIEVGENFAEEFCREVVPA